MPSKPSTPTKKSAPLPSARRSTTDRESGWLDLKSTGKRCWFAELPRDKSEVDNYINIMNDFSLALNKRKGVGEYQHLFVVKNNRITTLGTSESSRPEDREPHMTVVYSENLEADPFYARTVHVYLEGEVPNATYDRYSDPSRSKDRSVFIRKTIEKCNHTLPLDDPWKFSIPTTTTTEGAAITPIATTTHTATRTGTDTQISDTAPPEPANQSEPTEGTWNRVTHRKWRGRGGGTRGRGGRGRGSGGGDHPNAGGSF